MLVSVASCLQSRQREAIHSREGGWLQPPRQLPAPVLMATHRGTAQDEPPEALHLVISRRQVFSTLHPKPPPVNWNSFALTKLMYSIVPILLWNLT